MRNSSTSIIALLGASAVLLVGCSQGPTSTSSLTKCVTVSEVMAKAAENEGAREPQVVVARLGAGDEYGRLVHDMYLVQNGFRPDASVQMAGAETVWLEP